MRSYELKDVIFTVSTGLKTEIESREGVVDSAFGTLYYFTSKFEILT